MPHSYGVRARTRHMFAKKFRQHGPTHLSQYFIPVKVGDYVDIFANPAIHKGMPHKHYHGRTGIVFNVKRLELVAAMEAGSGARGGKLAAALEGRWHCILRLVWRWGQGLRACRLRSRQIGVLCQLPCDALSVDLI